MRMCLTAGLGFGYQAIHPGFSSDSSLGRQMPSFPGCDSGSESSHMINNCYSGCCRPANGGAPKGLAQGHLPAPPPQADTNEPVSEHSFECYKFTKADLDTGLPKSEMCLT